MRTYHQHPDDVLELHGDITDEVLFILPPACSSSLVVSGALNTSLRDKSNATLHK